MIELTKGNFVKNFLKFPKKNILLTLLALGFGEWLISDFMHFSGGSLGFIILSFGAYFYLKDDQPKFHEPRNLKGWIDLCKEDLKYFEDLEENNEFPKNNIHRKEKFEQILKEVQKQRILLITETRQKEYISFFNKYFKKDKYSLNIIKSFSGNLSLLELPGNFIDHEVIVYTLNLPLSAKDFLWLDKFQDNLPIWLAIPFLNNSEYKNEFEALKTQIPERYLNKIIQFDLNNSKHQVPISFRRLIINPRKNIDDTKIRLLREFHIELQSEIDVIRRLKLKDIQNKNQILIAASVLASPVPSIDVLSMTILNSLMIKEIKNTWGCNWSPEMLNVVSKQIIKTAIAQGVVEWSSQALLSLSKLHGPNWLIAGSIQAVSAAYLTRVVSRSLADFMSISKGISEPSLEFINNHSEKIVSDAFESEKINWKKLITTFNTPLKTKYS